MYLVVYGLRNAGLTAYLAHGLDWLGGRGPWSAAIGTGFGAAILSSVMNNMPSVLVGSLAIEQAPACRPDPRADGLRQCHRLRSRPEVHPHRQPGHAALAARASRKGQTIGWGQYMRVGLVITPPVLLVVLAALTLRLTAMGLP